MRNKWYRFCACALAVSMLLSGAAFAAELPGDSEEPAAVELPLDAEPIYTAEVNSRYDSLDPDHSVSLFESKNAEWPASATEYRDQLSTDAKGYYDLCEKAFADNSWEIMEIDGANCVAITRTYSLTVEGDFDTWWKEWQKEHEETPMQAGFAFVNDHPEYFWIRTAFRSFIRAAGSGTQINITVEFGFELYPPYATTNKTNLLKLIQEKQGAINSAVSEIRTATEGMSDYDKIDYFDSWLAENNKYSSKAAGTANYMYEVDSTPWSAVSALTGVCGPVCEGYAKAFKLLCEQVASVPCITISGEGTNSEGDSEGHMWTAVQLDGAWYFCDPTWDDPGTDNNSSSKSTKNYFLIAAPDTHIVQQEFAIPTLSAKDYELSYEGFTLTNSAFTGGVTKTANGDLWVALYNSNGKMLECKQAIARGRLDDGSYGYRAPSFSGTAISSAAKAETYHVNAQWQPVSGAAKVTYTKK